MSGVGIGIRYLNGWAMAAADGAKKEVAEWPPHPDRVFMALAAAWFETGQDAAEGAALRWLESLPVPSIAASDASFRTASGSDRPTTSYVPVNDSARGKKVPESSDFAKLKDAGLALLPEFRSRQPRSFPVAVPRSDQVFLVWLEADPGSHREPLAALARKVTHVGHSASLTQVWLEGNPPVSNLWPTDGVSVYRLRVFGSGRLTDLEARANREAVLAYAELTSQVDSAKGKARKELQMQLAERFGDGRPESRRPEPGLWKGYTNTRPQSPPQVPHSIFDPNLVVLALSGHRVSLSATLRLVEALRGAVQSACPEPIPEWVSGHAADGSPSSQPHLAFVPLPFVDAERGDGRILGVGLVPPRGLDPAEAARCLGPLLYTSSGLPRAITLYQGQWLECEAALEQRESPPQSLRADRWCKQSNQWASVTPIVLDRHFDGRDKWERAAESVKDSCQRIGLPRPTAVVLQPVSMIEGVPHAREFPHLTRKSDGGRMHHSHAVLIFDEPVEGPVLIGAGRYRGYGMFKPLGEGKR